MKKNFILTALFLGLFLVSCKDETPETKPNGLFNWKVTYYTYNRAWTYYTNQEVIDDKYPTPQIWYKDSTVYQKTSAQVDSIIAIKQDTRFGAGMHWGDDKRRANVYQYVHLTKTVIK
jgi:hypothetical protein